MSNSQTYAYLRLASALLAVNTLGQTADLGGRAELLGRQQYGNWWSGSYGLARPGLNCLGGPGLTAADSAARLVSSRLASRCESLIPALLATSIRALVATG